jgi:SAM-dependent methyltransferase
MIGKIYRARFNPTTIAAKGELWKVLVEEFLQSYVPTNSSVADIGGGYCEFINNIRCRQKYVVDLNPDVKIHADPDVEILVYDATKMIGLSDGSLDIAFASNFFEHLPSKQRLFEVLTEIRRVLRKGGRLLIIQPNIKYAPREYWDFIDHHIPLTENSLGEALLASGFEIEECIPRFLPFSVKMSALRSTRLLHLYLKMPLLWRMFGKQTFMIGVKS